MSRELNLSRSNGNPHCDEDGVDGRQIRQVGSETRKQVVERINSGGRLQDNELRLILLGCGETHTIPIVSVRTTIAFASRVTKRSEVRCSTRFDWVERKRAPRSGAALACSTLNTAQNWLTYARSTGGAPPAPPATAAANRADLQPSNEKHINSNNTTQTF